MKKITINLSTQKETAVDSILENIVSYTPLVSLTATLVFAIILLLQLFIFKQGYEYAKHNRKWQKWEGKYNLIRGIRKEISGLEDVKKRLGEILTPEYDTVFILGDIFSSLPKNVWFKELDFRGETIDLKGYVVRWNEDYLVSLDRFISSLREKEYFFSKFKKINIKESKKTTFNGLETVKFVIECRK